MKTYLIRQTTFIVTFLLFLFSITYVSAATPAKQIGKTLPIQKPELQKMQHQTSQIPLNQPNMNSVALLVWANEAAVSTYSYNFVTYRKSLQDASDYFTQKGWKAFMNALKESRILDNVISKKLVVSAVATGAPIILTQGIIRKKYTWKVQIPMLVTYQSATQLKKQSLVVTMLISRTQKNIGNRSIGIYQFIATPKK